MMESENEIRTDLPSARARRFESDKRDLSPPLVTTVRLVLENWTRTNLRPYATFSWLSLWIVWSSDLDLEQSLRPLLVFLAQI